MDVFILIVTTRRLLGCACHNTGSLPRHFSPFSVQLIPSPRISASTFTIVDHLPLSHPSPQLHALLSSLSFLPQVTRSHLPFDFRLDRPTSQHKVTSRISRSVHLKYGSSLTFPFLVSTVSHSPHLNSTRLVLLRSVLPALDVTAQTPKFPSI